MAPGEAKEETYAFREVKDPGTDFTPTEFDP